MISDLVNEGVISAMVLSLKLISAYIAIVWIALVYWTYRDIKRRTKDPALQCAATLLSLIFFLPGYWLYLMLRPRLTLSEVAEEELREAILAEYRGMNFCPGCHARVREEYVACPSCQMSLRAACPDCSHALQPDWAACPYCARVIAPAPAPQNRVVELPSDRVAAATAHA
jgi:hypothetical protein